MCGEVRDAAGKEQGTQGLFAHLTLLVVRRGYGPKPNGALRRLLRVFFLDPDGMKLEGMRYGERHAKAARAGAARKKDRGGEAQDDEALVLLQVRHRPAQECKDQRG